MTGRARFYLLYGRGKPRPCQPRASPFHTPVGMLLFVRCSINGISRTCAISAGIVRSNSLLFLVSQSRNPIHQIANACPTKKLEESRDLSHHVHNVPSESAGS